MKREGSVFTGIQVVFIKELKDYTGSIRMIILLGLISLTAAASVYNATQTLRSMAGEEPFLLLSLFTTAKDPLPSFVAFLGLLVPLVGIAMGFDSINSELQNRTLSRLLSQPIYRDALLIGKAVAALAALAITFFALWLLVIGCAMLIFGIPPSGEQIARAITFLIITLFYGAFWFVLSMLFSVTCLQQATSALVSLAFWLLFTVFWPMISNIIASVFNANPYKEALIKLGISIVSPNTLYSEATLAMLHPTTRSMKPVLYSQLQNALFGRPLPFGQSLLLIWPHLSGLIAAVLLVFAVTYIKFQRNEIRA